MKKTKKGRKAKAGVVSGNRACGQPLPGKCLILLDLDFGVKVFQSNIDGLEALLAS